MKIAVNLNLLPDMTWTCQLTTPLGGSTIINVHVIPVVTCFMNDSELIEWLVDNLMIIPSIAVPAGSDNSPTESNEMASMEW